MTTQKPFSEKRKVSEVSLRATIEKELRKTKLNSIQLWLVNQAIQSALKELKKKGFFVDKQYVADIEGMKKVSNCEMVIKWSEIEKTFGKVEE